MEEHTRDLLRFEAKIERTQRRLRGDKIEAEIECGKLRNETKSRIEARQNKLHRQQVARVARCDMVERLDVAVLTERMASSFRCLGALPLSLPLLTPRLRPKETRQQSKAFEVVTEGGLLQLPVNLTEPLARAVAHFGGRADDKDAGIGQSGEEADTEREVQHVCISELAQVAIKRYTFDSIFVAARAARAAAAARPPTPTLRPRILVNHLSICLCATVMSFWMCVAPRARQHPRI